jgi:hypothetical protein
MELKVKMKETCCDVKESKHKTNLQLKTQRLPLLLVFGLQ